MRTSAIALGIAGTLMAAYPAQSSSLLWDPAVDRCTALNCGAVLVGGSVLNLLNVSTARWEVAVYANAGECLRLDQTAVFGAAGIDDEMVVVAPNGTVYRNDDFTGLRPRVVIASAPSRGWYQVSIARFTGTPTPEHDFHFRFGRYVANVGNPNCASPTAPQLTPASAAAKQPSAATAPNPASPSGR